MHRENLLKLLEQYQPTDIKEINFKQQIIAFVKENEDCFERSLDIGHITASAWLLDKAGDNALLMHHAKLDKWFQPGGHADGDNNALAVAIKEAQEESGINGVIAMDNQIFDVDIHAIPANSKDKEHFHYDIRFLLQVQSNEELQINEESKELRWIFKNRADLPTDEESIIRMFDKWLLRK